MKRLFLVFLLLLGFSDAFSQVSVVSTVMRKKTKNSDEVLSVNTENIEFKTRQQRFDELDREGRKYRSMHDRRFIKKGDSVRFKYSFDPRFFDHIEVEGAVNPIMPRDMSKGEYIAVVRPEKTTVISAKLYLSEALGKKHFYEHRTVVVLEKEEFEKLDAELKEYEANKDAEGVAKINARVIEYLKAAGVDPEKLKHS